MTCLCSCSNPTPEPVEAPLGHGPVTWSALTEDELNYMWIHIDDVENRINYRQKEMAFVRDYMSYIVDREILADQGTYVRIVLVPVKLCCFERPCISVVVTMRSHRPSLNVIATSTFRIGIPGKTKAKQAGFVHDGESYDTNAVRRLQLQPRLKNVLTAYLIDTSLFNYNVNTKLTVAFACSLLLCHV